MPSDTAAPPCSPCARSAGLHWSECSREALLSHLGVCTRSPRHLWHPGPGTCRSSSPARQTPALPRAPGTISQNIGSGTLKQHSGTIWWLGLLGDTKDSLREVSNRVPEDKFITVYFMKSFVQYDPPGTRSSSMLGQWRRAFPHAPAPVSPCRSDSPQLTRVKRLRQRWHKPRLGSKVMGVYSFIPAEFCISGENQFFVHLTKTNLTVGIAYTSNYAIFHFNRKQILLPLS